MRYGEKTLHEEHGVAVALNVGDLLIGEGYRLLAACKVSAEQRARMLLVASQVMQAFEGQKRTSTGGNDSQTNGALAVYLLEQEIRMAGYGLFGPEGAYCRNGINIYKNNGAADEVVMNAVSAIGSSMCHNSLGSKDTTSGRTTISRCWVPKMSATRRA